MSFLSKFFGKKDVTSPLTIYEFAELYANKLRLAHPNSNVAVEHASSAAQTRVFWVTDDGIESNQFMGNGYSRYLQAPNQLQTLLSELLQQGNAARVSLNKPKSALESIFPVIKTLGWVAASTAQMDAADVPTHYRPLSLPFAGDLLLAYVQDTTESMSFIAPAFLDEVGLDLPALQALALKNLAQRLPELVVKGGAGRFAARLDRNYDASMVLLLSQWRDQLNVDGDPVFAIAARDDVLVCGSNDTLNLASLQEMAQSIVKDSPYSLSSQLYIWKDGHFHVFPA